MLVLKKGHYLPLVTSTVTVTSLLYLDCNRYKKGLLFVCATCMVVKVSGSGDFHHFHP